jgi:hypothetical protein
MDHGGPAPAATVAQAPAPRGPHSSARCQATDLPLPSTTAISGAGSWSATSSWPTTPIAATARQPVPGRLAPDGGQPDQNRPNDPVTEMNPMRLRRRRRQHRRAAADVAVARLHGVRRVGRVLAARGRCRRQGAAAGDHARPRARHHLCRHAPDAAGEHPVRRRRHAAPTRCRTTARSPACSRPRRRAWRLQRHHPHRGALQRGRQERPRAIRRHLHARTAGGVDGRAARGGRGTARSCSTCRSTCACRAATSSAAASTTPAAARSRC